MTLTQLFENCQAKGVEVFLMGDAVKIRGKSEQIKQLEPLLRERKPEILEYLKRAANDMVLLKQLESFNLQHVLEAKETERINNMAWEFMQIDGMTYAKAIRAAIEIVGCCRIAPCEAAYENVRVLWERLKKR